jgi:hypothetical protein
VSRELKSFDLDRSGRAEEPIRTPVEGQRVLWPSAQSQKGEVEDPQIIWPTKQPKVSEVVEDFDPEPQI